MTLVDGLIVLGIFVGFGLMIWTKLNNKNSPAVLKAKEYFKKKNIITPDLSDSDKYKQPMLERKIM